MRGLEILAQVIVLTCFFFLLPGSSDVPLSPYKFRNLKLYFINTSEIPSEVSRENFISSHVKIT